MLVREVMTRDARFVPASSTIKDAARMMRELECGFLPIGDKASDKLQGVVTDRDIVLRAVAAGLDPENTEVTKVKSDKVLYCFESDAIEDAAASMRKNQVYRLVVLDAPESKRFSGIISLGDVNREADSALSSRTASAIAARN
jgi:CBS domain-containing protein